MTTETPQTTPPRSNSLRLGELVERVARSIPEAQSLIDAYHVAATATEAEIEGQHAAERSLVEGAGKASIATLRKRGAELVERRAELVESLLGQLWARHELAKQLVPLFAEHGNDSAATYQQIRAAAIQDFRDRGIDAYAIPNGQYNGEAANQRLMRLVDERVECLQAFAAANRAAAALGEVRALAKHLPPKSAARIKWPTYSGENRHLAEVCGLMGSAI